MQNLDSKTSRLECTVSESVVLLVAVVVWLSSGGVHAVVVSVGRVTMVPVEHICARLIHIRGDETNHFFQQVCKV